ncbi:ATP-binding protein [Dethiosulfatarculus sandiegensis]|uniref:histidine kinase n=1 Tax=Dethiosulfatarculus sandiegensis TaxID=1429043 RepID=A0A0D2JE52_9BACT|nr:ATP-binding protein [Dethiosulfatarculus sandiegensis]KIX13916.1 hypothetical protein X474_12130 [Dethiosulfatarculus sandiegensis]
MGRDQAHIIDLKYLSETMMRMARASDLKSLAGIIFDFISTVITFDMCVIYKLNRAGEELEVVACKGASLPALRKRNRFQVGQGAVGWVAARRKALLVRDADHLEDFNIRQCKPEDPPIKSFLAAPLVAGDDLKGVMSISSTRPGQFREKQVQLISIIATELATLMQTNLRVRESEEFSSRILESINSGVMVVDKKGRLLAFNQAAQKITGHTMEKVLGRHIDRLNLTEPDKKLKILETLHNETPLFEAKNQLRQKDGKWVNVRLSTSLLRAQDGTVKGCICIFRDTTMEDKLTEQVMRAEKLSAVGRLTAGLAHEMCNPLLPIRTASSMLRLKAERLGEDPTCLSLLTTIEDESERLNRFLQNILHLFCKNPPMVFNSVCRVGETVRETVNLMAADLRKREISLDFFSDKAEALINLSKDNLKQILLNLIINSVEAIETRGKGPRRLCLETFTNSGELFLKVSDTGCGLDPEEKNNLFDPFYTTKEHGTGIGLYIVHRLVMEAGGRVSMEDLNPKGTCFCVVFPLSKDSACQMKLPGD